MREMRRVTSDDAFDLFTTGECRVQRIINATAHNSAMMGFSDGSLIIRNGECLDRKPLTQIQRQFRSDCGWHFVKPGESSKGLRQRVRIAETVAILREGGQSPLVF